MQYYVETSRYHNILWIRTGFSLPSAGKIEDVQELKIISSSCFIPDDTHAKIIWLYPVVFIEHDILHFWHNFHLLKYYSVKASQNCLNSFNCSNQTGTQASKFQFALDN